MTRTGACSCGQLRITCTGEPVRISICHCLECQKRTGSVYAAQARFPRTATTVEGKASHWSRSGDSGGTAKFSFCPTCSSIVFWEPESMPDFVMVAVGAFADPSFPPPRVSVYENRAHPWVFAANVLPMEHD